MQKILLVTLIEFRNRCVRNLIRHLFFLSMYSIGFLLCGVNQFARGLISVSYYTCVTGAFCCWRIRRTHIVLVKELTHTESCFIFPSRPSTNSHFSLSSSPYKRTLLISPSILMRALILADTCRSRVFVQCVVSKSIDPLPPSPHTRSATHGKRGGTHGGRGERFTRGVPVSSSFGPSRPDQFPHTP